MKKEEIIAKIRQRNSFLVVDLNPDMDKMPPQYRDTSSLAGSVYDYLREVASITNPYAVAYRLNLGYYLALGQIGTFLLANVIEWIKKELTNSFVILDANVGDIPIATAKYAKAFFEGYKADAVTVNPFFGKDCLQPFLKKDDAWIIVTALSSNSGSFDFQWTEENGEPLYKKVIEAEIPGSDSENTIYGVSQDMLSEVRRLRPNHFLFVPEFTGKWEQVKNSVIPGDCGLLIAVKNLIFDSSPDFDRNIELKTRNIVNKMREIL